MKLITDVLFVPDLDQNLLSVGQLLENSFKLLFEEKTCLIKDADSKEMFKIKMKGRSFNLNLLDKTQAAAVQLENDTWSWEDDEKQKNLEFLDEDVDDVPIKGTKTLFDIYQRCNVAVLEPGGFMEAAKDEKWRYAMQEELKIIEKNNTWELVDRPSHKKAVGVKRVYRTKLNPDGSINKYKARLVAKRYSQVFGADLYIEQKKSTEIFVDNQAAISIANNPVSHGKTKHFKIKLYFLREVQQNGDIALVHCKTDFQNATS